MFMLLNNWKLKCSLLYTFSRCSRWETGQEKQRRQISIQSKPTCLSRERDVFFESIPNKAVQNSLQFNLQTVQKYCETCSKILKLQRHCVVETCFVLVVRLSFELRASMERSVARSNRRSEFDVSRLRKGVPWSKDVPTKVFGHN